MVGGWNGADGRPEKDAVPDPQHPPTAAAEDASSEPVTFTAVVLVAFPANVHPDAAADRQVAG